MEIAIILLVGLAVCEGFSWVRESGRYIGRDDKHGNGDKEEGVGE